MIDPALSGCYGAEQKQMQMQILRLAALAQDDRNVVILS
jgi:hypothetical protein